MKIRTRTYTFPIKWFNHFTHWNKSILSGCLNFATSAINNITAFNCACDRVAFNGSHTLWFFSKRTLIALSVTSRRIALVFSVSNISWLRLVLTGKWGMLRVELPLVKPEPALLILVLSFASFFQLYILFSKDKSGVSLPNFKTNCAKSNISSLIGSLV